MSGEIKGNLLCNEGWGHVQLHDVARGRAKASNKHRSGATSRKSWSTEEARGPREESGEDTATEIDTVSRILGLSPLRTMWDTCQSQAVHREGRTERKSHNSNEEKE